MGELYESTKQPAVTVGGEIIMEHLVMVEQSIHVHLHISTSILYTKALLDLSFLSKEKAITITLAASKVTIHRQNMK